MKKQEGSDVPMSSHKRVRRGSSFDSRNVKSRERERERIFERSRDAIRSQRTTITILLLYCLLSC
jgi:hypothetical protein